jgi:hypothetical protein
VHGAHTHTALTHKENEHSHPKAMKTLSTEVHRDSASTNARDTGADFWMASEQRFR